jgi:hypothetical protein
MMLGESISQRYLSPSDLLIGVHGEAGIGKSSLIRGMFPGLELTNDDEGINVRPVPLIHMHREGHFRAHTFHVDIRFEMAFAPLYEIAEAIRAALVAGHRIIAEHFETVYPLLGINAQFLVGIGEDILVARPNVFGPFPQDIVQAIAGTAVFRRMAHSAEDLTSLVLEREFGISQPDAHSDVPRGFVIEFEREPDLDLERLEQRVLDLIAQGIEIDYLDPGHIRVGDTPYGCTGPRIHVANTSEIRGFRLVRPLVYDEMDQTYCLVGQVAEPRPFPFIGRHPDSAVPLPHEEETH